MSRDSVSQFNDGWDAQIATYRPLSKLAVAGMIWGMFAAAALIDPFLWIVPALGLLMNSLALWHIAGNVPELLGRKAALVGLSLSILFGIAAPTQWYGYRFMIDREARQVAEAWFEFLARGEVHKAHQLTVHPKYRQPLDDKLAQFYQETAHWRGELNDYRQIPLIRFLEQHGKNAVVRYYQTRGFQRKPEQEIVYLRYEVTYGQSDQEDSLLVDLELHRVSLEDGRVDWLVEHAQSGNLPKGW